MIVTEAELAKVAQLYERPSHLELQGHPPTTAEILTADFFIRRIEAFLPEDWCWSLTCLQRNEKLVFCAGAFLEEDTSIGRTSEWYDCPENALESLFYQLRDL